MSDFLWPHGWQHARLPCPSPTPGVCSNSCPSSWWCHPTISFSVVPLSLAFNLSQHQGLFQWVSSSQQVAKVLELQLQHQSSQWTFRTDFLRDWMVWFPCWTLKSLIQHHSSKASIIQFSTLFMVLISHPYITSGKIIAFARHTSHTAFPIFNKSIVPCLVVTVASWPAYRFLRRQARWSGIPISWRIFQFFMIHTVKGFSAVHEAEVDIFSGIL